MILNFHITGQRENAATPRALTVRESGMALRPAKTDESRPRAPRIPDQLGNAAPPSRDREEVQMALRAAKCDESHVGSSVSWQ